MGVFLSSWIQSNTGYVYLIILKFRTAGIRLRQRTGYRIAPWTPAKRPDRGVIIETFHILRSHFKVLIGKLPFRLKYYWYWRVFCLVLKFVFWHCFVYFRLKVVYWRSKITMVTKDDEYDYLFKGKNILNKYYKDILTKTLLFLLL